ncbi:MAG: ribosome small subunit-dependent GTPase A [Spirochaetales bacterium]|nr:ribosome small subunit-dependent GTPase A [Spirochaetales bacterium]
MKGRVLFGINNIYSVKTESGIFECRIKGKVFQEENRTYNPIAVGDWVTIDADPNNHLKAMIIGRDERRTVLSRWNRKKQCPQILASNVEILVIVTSAAFPPFRPRFIDRMIISAEAGHVHPIICMNKIDLGVEAEVMQRLREYETVGYEVFHVSAKSGEGLEALRQMLKSKTTVFAGQSGVGKSSILNALVPDLGLRVGDISLKNDRGAHTTNFATMIEIPDQFTLVDTPGIRELDLDGIASADIRFYFPEFKNLQQKCNFPSCVHIDEPKCAVKAAVEDGDIYTNRYDSYCRVYADVREREKKTYE